MELSVALINGADLVMLSAIRVLDRQTDRQTLNTTLYITHFGKKKFLYINEKKRLLLDKIF